MQHLGETQEERRPTGKNNIHLNFKISINLMLRKKKLHVCSEGKKIRAVEE